MFKSKKNQRHFSCKSQRCVGSFFYPMDHGSPWFFSMALPGHHRITARFSPATLCTRLGVCGPGQGLGPGGCHTLPAAAVVPGEPWGQGMGGGDQEITDITDVYRCVCLCLIYIYIYVITVYIYIYIYYIIIYTGIYIWIMCTSVSLYTYM